MICLLHRNSIEVDLNDLLSTDKIFDVLCCDSTLHSHLPDKEFCILYLLGPIALVFLAEIGNAMAHKNKTTWATTDTRLDRNVFFTGAISREIAIDELAGGGAPRDSLGYMALISGGDATEKIQDLKNLMSRQPVGRNRGNRG